MLFRSHEQRYLMRRVKLPGLFSRVGRKVADQIFVNKAQDIVVLFAVGGDILNQLNQLADGFGLAAGGVAKFAQAGFQGVENFAENLFLCFADQAVERGESGSDIIHGEAAALCQPGGEEMLVGDKIPEAKLTVAYEVRVVFMNMLLNIRVSITVCFEKADLLIRQKLIKIKPGI